MMAAGKKRESAKGVKGGGLGGRGRLDGRKGRVYKGRGGGSGKTRGGRTMMFADLTVGRRSGKKAIRPLDQGRKGEALPMKAIQHRIAVMIAGLACFLFVAKAQCQQSRNISVDISVDVSGASFASVDMTPTFGFSGSTHPQRRWAPSVRPVAVRKPVQSAAPATETFDVGRYARERPEWANRWKQRNKNFGSGS